MNRRLASICLTIMTACFVTSVQARNAFGQEQILKTASAGECATLEPDGRFLKAVLAPQDGTRRVAFVLGNGAYVTAGVLANAKQDAIAVSQKLQALGFLVIRGLDLDSSGYQKCRDVFFSSIQSSDSALLYYSGHGIQIEDKNYLLAIDAAASRDAEPRGFISVNELMTGMRRAAARSIVFLDACRNNPLADATAKQVGGRQVNFNERGLAVIGVEAEGRDSQAGVFVAYATSPNRVAADGPAGEHSPFTKAFLNSVATPGFSIQRMMSRISKEVGDATKFRQTPWSDSSLTDDFFFNGELELDQLTTLSEKYVKESYELMRAGARQEAMAAALKALPLEQGLPSAYSPAAGSRFGQAQVALYRAFLSRAQRLAGHSLPLSDAAFSPDGKRIVTGSTDATARVWDSVTGQQLLLLQGHERNVSTVKFSPDGSRIATASDDNTARLWDARTGANLSILRHPEKVDNIRFSPNGDRVVTAANSGVRIWDVSNGQMVLAVREDARDALFNPEGNRILAFANNDVRVWDATTGRLEVTLSISLAEFYGKTTERTNNGTVNYDVPARVNTAEYSPDGQTILTASVDSVARLWDAQTGKLLARFAGNEQRLTTGFSASFSEDGKRIITAAADGTARVWDSKTRQQQLVLKHDAGVGTARFIRNGTLIVSSSRDPGQSRNNWIAVWDAATGERLDWIAQQNWHSLQFSLPSPAGDRLLSIAAADNAALVWTLHETGRQSPPPVVAKPHEPGFKESGEDVLFPRGSITVFSRGAISGDMTPDATRLVIGSSDGAARFYDAKTGAQTFMLEDHDFAVWHTAFRPDGARVLTMGDVPRLWDATSGKLLGVLDRGAYRRDDEKTFARAAEFSPDGTRIATAAGLDGAVMIWDGTTGAFLSQLAGPGARVMEIEFSPDGGRIATASEDDVVHIWDVIGRVETLQMAFPESVTSLSFSPDGSRIVTGTLADTVVVWDLKTGGQIAVYRLDHKGTHSAVFSPDGRRILVSGRDKSYRIIHAEAGAKPIVLSIPDTDLRPFLPGEAVFSPDGQRVMMTAGLTVELFDTASGMWVDRFMGAGDDRRIREVNFAAFGSRGNAILSGSKDGSARVWTSPYGMSLIQAAFEQLHSPLQEAVRNERIKYFEID